MALVWRTQEFFSDYVVAWNSQLIVWMASVTIFDVRTFLFDSDYGQKFQLTGVVCCVVQLLLVYERIKIE